MPTESLSVQNMRFVSL